MNIDAATAVSHIVNSMDNTNCASWTDEDDITWTVSNNYDGTIVFELTNDNDETVECVVFKLVKETYE